MISTKWCVLQIPRLGWVSCHRFHLSRVVSVPSWTLVMVKIPPDWSVLSYHLGDTKPCVVFGAGYDLIRSPHMVEGIGVKSLYRRVFYVLWTPLGLTLSVL